MPPTAKPGPLTEVIAIMGGLIWTGAALRLARGHMIDGMVFFVLGLVFLMGSLGGRFAQPRKMLGRAERRAEYWIAVSGAALLLLVGGVRMRSTGDALSTIPILAGLVLVALERSGLADVAWRRGETWLRHHILRGAPSTRTVPQQAGKGATAVAPRPDVGGARAPTRGIPVVAPTDAPPTRRERPVAGGSRNETYWRRVANNISARIDSGRSLAALATFAARAPTNSWPRLTVGKLKGLIPEPIAVASAVDDLPESEQMRRALNARAGTLKLTADDDVDELRTSLAREAAKDERLAWLLEPESRDTLTVAVLGEFSAGKSRLINALLGTDALPTGMEPVNASIARLIWHESPQAWVEMHDGARHELAIEEIGPYLDEREKEDPARNVREVTIGLPAEPLKRFDLLDTPGFNAGASVLHDQVAQQIVQQADAVLWVLTAAAAAGEAELRELKHIERAVEKCVGVLNQIDEIRPRYTRNEEQWREELDDLTDDVKEKLGHVLPTVVPVSAKWIEEGHPESGQKGLLHALRSLTDRAEELRAKSLVRRHQELALKEKARRELVAEAQKARAAWEALRREEAQDRQKTLEQDWWDAERLRARTTATSKELAFPKTYESAAMLLLCAREPKPKDAALVPAWARLHWYGEALGRDREYLCSAMLRKAFEWARRVDGAPTSPWIPASAPHPTSEGLIQDLLWSGTASDESHGSTGASLRMPWYGDAPFCKPRRKNLHFEECLQGPWGANDTREIRRALPGLHGAPERALRLRRVLQAMHTAGTRKMNLLKVHWEDISFEKEDAKGHPWPDVWRVAQLGAHLRRELVEEYAGHKKATTEHEDLVSSRREAKARALNGISGEFRPRGFTGLLAVTGFVVGMAGSDGNVVSGLLGAAILGALGAGIDWIIQQVVCGVRQIAVAADPSFREPRKPPALGKALAPHRKAHAALEKALREARRSTPWKLPTLTSWAAVPREFLPSIECDGLLRVE